jgi:hypothetical protein
MRKLRRNAKASNQRTGIQEWKLKRRKELQYNEKREDDNYTVEESCLKEGRKTKG